MEADATYLKQTVTWWSNRSNINMNHKNAKKVFNFSYIILLFWFKIHWQKYFIMLMTFCHWLCRKSAIWQYDPFLWSQWQKLNKHDKTSVSVYGFYDIAIKNSWNQHMIIDFLQCLFHQIWDRIFKPINTKQNHVLSDWWWFWWKSVSVTNFVKKRNTSLWLKLVKMIFVLIFIELIVKLQFSIYQDNWSVMGFEKFWPDLTITFGKSKSNHLQYKLVSHLWNKALVCLFWCHGKSKYKWQPWVSIIDYDVNWLM